MGINGNLVLFINAHRSPLLPMMSEKAQSLSPTGAPSSTGGSWKKILPKPGAMTEEVCNSEPMAQKFEPVNSNNSSFQMFSDVFSTLFFGVQKTYKTHQKPSKTIKNHQKPSKTTLLRETPMGFFSR